METIILDLEDHKYNIEEKGFTVIDNIFEDHEVNGILDMISGIDTSKPTFRKSADLFAIRQFFKELPDSIELLFNKKIKKTIEALFGTGCFVVKSIYFDKPEQSNWFVAYHQDLTISVAKKADISGFGPWTVKQDQFAVQPTTDILKSNFTIRVHLDDTNEENGALKVIPGSHKEILRPENIDWEVASEYCCNVPKGGVMIMKPLLLHSSGRTINGRKRRVIHIEFGSRQLPDGLQWSEYLDFEKGVKKLGF
jgi:ectoine hydroxylase-related dioxygenase (phytanoyl-CoA dioxygenase family)